MKKMSIELAMVIVILGSLPAIGFPFGGPLPVGQLTGGFTTAVITDGSEKAIVEKFVDDLIDDGGTCLPDQDPIYQDYIYCEIQKTSYGEHISIGTVRGVGIDADKARIVVEFTLFFKKRINLNVFPVEFRNLINRIGGSL